MGIQSEASCQHLDVSQFQTLEENFDARPHVCHTPRSAQILRDFLTPLSNGSVIVEELALPGRAKLQISNGQCLLDHLRLHEFVSQIWWQQFWDRLQTWLKFMAGQPENEKVVTSNPVGCSASCKVIRRSPAVPILKKRKATPQLHLLAQACLTVGELVAVLLLDGEPKCHDCAIVLARQCTGLMTSQFYSYAQLRGGSFERIGTMAMAASIKETAISKVISGEKPTLEASLESMGYNRQQAGVIFKDRRAHNTMPVLASLFRCSPFPRITLARSCTATAWSWQTTPTFRPAAHPI